MPWPCWSSPVGKACTTTPRASATGTPCRTGAARKSCRSAKCPTTKPVGAGLLAIWTPRFIRHTALSFIASKPAPTKMWRLYEPRRNPGFVVSGYPAIIRRILRGIY
ncbi:hypothetical protein EMIT0P44_10024 [Pseudomonas sp. IT-P44]